MITAIARRRSRDRSAAFTLMEIILVVVIIGILLTLVGPKLAGRTEKAKRTAARNQMQAFKTAIQMFEADTGRFPKDLKELTERPSDVDEKVWNPGGYLDAKELPLDPWGHEYVYRYPGEHGDFDISSDGFDGRAGTDDDIRSWEVRSVKR
ncbi:type II secretion system major pseudopilin GspG [Candidatus Sumerlaeota bacterium]|nr:type II secretion system major pseudopilin GspG [Candidatus Sumerlaeota bacterium]